MADGEPLNPCQLVDIQLAWDTTIDYDGELSIALVSRKLIKNHLGEKNWTEWKLVPNVEEVE